MTDQPPISTERRNICGDCATLREGRYREGHAVTLCAAPCDYCGQVAVVCDIDDYTWPNPRQALWD